jgi:hypothetical protein
VLLCWKKKLHFSSSPWALPIHRKIRWPSFIVSTQLVLKFASSLRDFKRLVRRSPLSRISNSEFLLIHIFIFIYLKDLTHYINNIKVTI